MNKYILTLTTLLFCLVLTAQTQTLPDILVPGESEVKPYLQKRHLSFRTMDEQADSLMGYIPQTLNLPLPNKGAKSKPRSGFLRLGGNSEPGINSYVVLYPRSDFIRRISHQLQYQHLQDGKSYLDTGLNLGYALSDSLPLVTRIAYADHRRRHYQLKVWDLGLDAFLPKLNLGSWSWTDLAMQTTYHDLQQQLLHIGDEQSDFGVALSSVTHYKWLNLKTKFQSSDDQVGGYLAPSLPWEPLGIKELRIGLLAKAETCLPTVEFRYRTTITDGLSLNIANKPSIGAESYYELLNKYPWLSFDDSAELSITPLDLSISLEMLKAAEETKTSTRFLLLDDLSYQVDVPYLLSGSVPGVAQLAYTDLLHHYSGITMLHHRGSLLLKQTAGVNLDYLPDYSYIRAAYLPRYEFDTQLRYSYRRWNFDAGFAQHYNIRDHHGKSLPEALNLSIGCDYSYRNGSLYLLLDNLLEKAPRVFSEYPRPACLLYLGIKQRF